MIKVTKKNLSLAEHKPKRGRRRGMLEVPTITVFISKGRIQFNRYAIEEMKLEGKLLKFFYDNQDSNIIGWKAEPDMIMDEVKHKYRCKIHSNGVWRVSISKLITQMIKASSASKKWGSIYRNVPVEKYEKDGNAYFFVDLKDDYKE